MNMPLLYAGQTALLIIDIQDKLMAVMGNPDRVMDRTAQLLRLARVFDLPVILTEQYSRWLGSTLTPIKKALTQYDPIEKRHFDCCQVPEFNERLASNDLRDLILTGVETHICVFQTCISLLRKGYRVHVPHHAVDSRTTDNWRIGLSLMKAGGAVITSTEALIFQLLKKAGTPEFKEMMNVVK